jgi:hypothetical protein
LYEWGFSLVRETVHCVADNLLLDPNLLDIEADTRRIILDVLEAFWSRPVTEEAKAFSDFPYELGFGRDSYSAPLTERYGWKHVTKALCTGRLQRAHGATWDEASALLTPRIVRFALRASLRSSHCLKRLRSSIKGAVAVAVNGPQRTAQ